jgi:hypothetical protein
MDSRDIFLVAALLSAGAFIRFILVLSGQPVTPNVMVAFYSIAIMVILPSFGEAIGIGLVSGGITALISRSLINPAFLLSEPLGAAVCLTAFTILRYHKRIAPYAAALTATIASGAVFTALAVSFASTRISDAFGYPGNYVALMALVTIATAFINALIAGLIYPALVHLRERTPS